MTKKIFSIIVLVVFSANVFSQTKDTIKEKEWIVKWSPSSAIDIFTFPTIQFGLEKKLNKYFSVQTEFGIQLYDLEGKADTVSVKVEGFKVNAEGRFYAVKYFRKNKTNKRNIDGLYIGIQTFYRENKYNATNSYYIKQSDNSGDVTRFTDYFGVIKKAFGGNVVLGYQKQFLKRFVLEPHLNIGYMDRKIININRELENPTHIDGNGPHNFFGNSNNQKFSGNIINFSLGLRLGYQF